MKNSQFLKRGHREGTAQEWRCMALDSVSQGGVEVHLAVAQPPVSCTSLNATCFSCASTPRTFALHSPPHFASPHTCMNAHWVDVLNGADDDTVVAEVTHHLQLIFLPANEGHLNQNLRPGMHANSACEWSGSRYEAQPPNPTTFCLLSHSPGWS